MTNKPYQLWIVGPMPTVPSYVTIVEEDEFFYYAEVIKGKLTEFAKVGNGYSYFKDREEAFNASIQNATLERSRLKLIDKKLEEHIKNVRKLRDGQN